MTIQPPPVSIIVAIAENGVIGNAGGIPWRLSSDLRRFKKITMGHHLIMGRKTWDSIGRPLPGRTSIVLSRSLDQLDGAHVCRDLDEALQIAHDDSEVFVIGGCEIYKLALPYARKVYLTRVQQPIEGDTRLDTSMFDTGWERTGPVETFDVGERDEVPHTFEILVSKRQEDSAHV